MTAFIKKLKSFQHSQMQYKIINYSLLKVLDIIQLLHLNEINMRFYGAEYNNIERDECRVNIVVLCSIKPHIDQVQL
jgi:hypothetical protein